MAINDENEYTSESIKFTYWLEYMMQKNEIKTYDELARRLHITRQTLFNWKKNPSKISFLNLAGMMHILDGVKNLDSVTALCKNFGLFE